MFGLLRLFFLLPIAFVVGMLWERYNAGEACAQAGGEMIAGVCTPR